MEFKDYLRLLIEYNGGASQDNMQRWVGKMRKIKPDFSVQRLQNLLRGHRPSDDERFAVCQVLEPESERWMSAHWNVEDQESRRCAKIALENTRSHVIAKEFVDYVVEEASFRNESLSDNDIRGLYKDYRTSNELLEEIAQFGLTV